MICLWSRRDRSHLPSAEPAGPNSVEHFRGPRSEVRSDFTPHRVHSSSFLLDSEHHWQQSSGLSLKCKVAVIGRDLCGLWYCGSHVPSAERAGRSSAEHFRHPSMELFHSTPTRVEAREWPWGFQPKTGNWLPHRASSSLHVLRLLVV